MNPSIFKLSDLTEIEVLNRRARVVGEKDLHSRYWRAKPSLAWMLAMLLPIYSIANQIDCLNDIEELVWQNRILVIFSNEPQPYQLLLSDAQADIDERDIVWFIITDNGVLSNYPGEMTKAFASNTTQRYFTDDDVVILIGKDGGVKNRQGELDLTAVFQQIDAMPMRIREMR